MIITQLSQFCLTHGIFPTKFFFFVGGSLDKPQEGSQKPHFVFPMPSSSTYILCFLPSPTKVKVLLLGKYKF
ncbi:hypothetical protein SLEP1_g58105 [Rubroshorea leprosula]|uniref:Uncharacterized protein n=1 Tax=Rubroshorea leprosula TaxID=152421 RepID=A0AAV5MPT6_9ROSI|nr:hypothetical protein SLEP1_g58105 [Rubroshorea leprosula]